MTPVAWRKIRLGAKTGVGAMSNSMRCTQVSVEWIFGVLTAKTVLTTDKQRLNKFENNAVLFPKNM